MSVREQLLLCGLQICFHLHQGLGNDYRFHNYKLTITAPDGTVTTQSYSVVTDPTSAQDYSFTPSQVGTYNFTFTFPGQDFNTYSHDTIIPAFFGPATPETLINDTYLPSSASASLTVQQQAIPFTGTYPLPTEYWTRPIYGENPGWWTISSNWLGSGSPVEASAGSWAIGAYGANSLFAGAALNRNPGDAIGSLTNHVMWTKPLQQGGIVGGNNFDIIGDSYFEGSAYVQRYDNPIIMDGILYYQAPLGYSSGQGGGTYAVDLQTGKVLWQNNAIPTGALSFGYIYDSQQPNQKGVMQPILFTSSFAQAYDAYTGQYLFNVSNVPSGVPISMGPNGEAVMYPISNGYLAEWNSSGLWNWNILVGGGVPAAATTNFNIITPASPFGPASTTSYFNTVNGGAAQCYDWNVSLPSLPSSFSQVAAFYGNMILCESGPLSGVSIGLLSGGVSSSWAPYTYFALNLNASRGAVGSVMWTNTVPAAPGNVTVLFGPADPTSGVFTEGYKETMQWVGYNLYTGAKLWGPTPSQAPLDYYGNPITPLIQAQLAYGNLYSMGYAGIMYCYDAKTGTLKWTYGNDGAGNSTNAGLNSPFGDYPTFINAVGNGVIYVVASEHTINTPIYKGALERAINATNGAEIWTISGYTGEFSAMSYAMADGYNTWFNGYDNQIYTVGRGPSALTVTAPNNAADSGIPVVIRGTVMDKSAGTMQTQQAGQFPNGVPVASDASMKDWMGYVYQQKPLPTNFTGVQVTVDVVDSNGNYRNIGSATTDATGMYSLAWTPNISGNYTVIATFHGTNGYWPSYSETTFVVASPHETSVPASPTPAPSAADLYFVPAIAGLFVLIIIVAIVLAMLMLRKRP